MAATENVHSIRLRQVGLFSRGEEVFIRDSKNSMGPRSGKFNEAVLKF